MNNWHNETLPRGKVFQWHKLFCGGHIGVQNLNHSREHQPNDGEQSTHLWTLSWRPVNFHANHADRLEISKIMIPMGTTPAESRSRSNTLLTVGSLPWGRRFFDLSSNFWRILSAPLHLRIKMSQYGMSFVKWRLYYELTFGWRNSQLYTSSYTGSRHQLNRFWDILIFWKWLVLHHDNMNYLLRVFLKRKRS